MKTLLFVLSLIVSITTFNFSAEAQSAKPKIKVLSVEKSMRKLILFDDKMRVYKTYDIALGKQPEGRKEKEGDGKTPEGRYKITYKNPKSDFYLSLQVSYPNSYDLKNAKAKGVSPGSDIMIHGIGKSYGWVGSAHTLIDWTQGCIAVTNEEMEEIYSLVEVGTVIYIWP